MQDWSAVAVPAGTSLWRHHNSVYPADELRPAHPNPTGRFDCPDPDGWASSYYAFTTRGTFGETLLRDVAVSMNAVNSRRLIGTSVSRVVATRDLELVDLRGAAAWGPLDNQLELLGFPTDADTTVYPRARQAAASIKRRKPESDGLCWLSARDGTQQSVLLWSDDGTVPLAVAATTQVTTDEFSAIASMLAPWGVPLLTGDDHVVPNDVAAGILGWTQ